MVYPKENLLAAIRFTGPEHVPYAGEGAYALVDYRGRRPPRAGTDDWGVTWAPHPEGYVAGDGEPAFSYPAAHPAHSAAALVRLPFVPAADVTRFAGLLDGLDGTRTLIIGQHEAGPLERFEALLGPEQALADLLDEPTASRDALERIADYHIGIARGYIAAGVGAGWLADDYAGQTGPLLSPRLWRRMVLPGLVRVIEVYRDAGLPVFFHTCGRAEAFVPDLLEAGASVFNLQSDVCDLPALATQFGRRIVFIGGVGSALMLRGSPDDVRRSARSAIRDLGQRYETGTGRRGLGGLILAPDQNLVFPTDNEHALRDTAARDGRYP
jgi:hypothetical protein